jgi:hypothetical protein
MSKYTVNIQKPEMKFDEKSAISEFERMANRWRSKIDQDDDQAKADVGMSIDKVIDAIRAGRIGVGEDALPVLYVDGKDDLKFYPPNGSVTMAMDQRKKDHDVSKVYAGLAKWTKTSVPTFGKMEPADLDLCLALFVLFFG